MLLFSSSSMIIWPEVMKVDGPVEDVTTGTDPVTFMELKS